MRLVIIPPGAEKFELPPVAPFGYGPAALSALSLLAFAAASVFAINTGLERQAPWWAVAPFAATAIGSGGGFLYEFWLLVTGRPFQLLGTPLGRHIQTLRLGNLALVFGATYLAYFLFGSPSTPRIYLVGPFIGLVVGFLLVNLMFRGPMLAVMVPLMIGLVAQVVFLYVPPLAGGHEARAWLLGAAVGLFATLLIGAQTPLRSTLFHVVGTGVVVALWFGTAAQLAAAPGPDVPLGDSALWLVAAALVGAVLAFRFLRGTWAVFRSGLSNVIWPLFYLVVAGGMRIPRPRRLGDLYKGREDQLKPLHLEPYYRAHPRNQSHPVSIPALDEALTVKVHALGFLGVLVRVVFDIGSRISQVFPMANPEVPLGYKPRMERWSGGGEYWPWWLRRTIWLPYLGWFSIQSGVRGPGYQGTPDFAIARYKEGQLLAYLAEYGAAESFLKPVRVPDGRAGFELDFRFLEHYESKPDYERYGGSAFFVIDDTTRSLVLTHLRAPRTDAVLPADPLAPTFRHVEDIVLSSLYFYVVSGKHLVEIHMGLNLVEVALFNSFDARKEWFHPVRLALYPHLFAHELAEELTTENLIEDGAIFPQIFATTGAALVRHLNDRFSEYQLGVDEDFDGREQRLLAGRAGAKLEDVLPNCSLVWEKAYVAVWQEYAASLVTAAFPSDAAVAADEGVRTLFEQLGTAFMRPLPDRYAGLATRAGLARFIADTIHHLVLRHEIYGTTAVRLALDPRISKVQVPKDGGPYAVDEWRALACIATATSRVRYTLFMASDWSDAFDDLKDPAVLAAYKGAYTRMKAQLTALGTRWRSDGRNNYDTLRVLPEELDLGAGY
ncbi:hypothetical protein R5W24_001469 [Gemmata sp. JC717]|uniref:hypothetical protein n=1 Tax=Gemmata algarum TaxID=2975278 RepID=UPI0021BB5E79|nr:hypothetical protein [Gemmata algarum]MDY3552387.1 hypothetical protein [Gemmata algarum]